MPVFSFSMEMGGPGVEGPPGSDAAVEVSGSGEGETEQREPSRIEHQAPPVAEIPALRRAQGSRWVRKSDWMLSEPTNFIESWMLGLERTRGSRLP